MVHLKGLQHERSELDLLERLGKFVVNDFKRKLRCDDAEAIDHALEPLRADHVQRLGTLGVPHRKKHPRQTGDMIRMVVREADHIDRLRRP